MKGHFAVMKDGRWFDVQFRNQALQSFHKFGTLRNHRNYFDFVHLN